MDFAARAAGKAGALLAALIVIGFASAASAQCADPLHLPVEYGSLSFTQTRHLNGVRAPLVSRGRAVIAAERVEWNVNDPIDIRTTITESGITQSVENGPAQRVGPQGDAFLSSAGLFNLLAGDFSSLGSHYTIARGAAGANGRWTVRLTPRAEALARFVSYIEVGGCEGVRAVEVRQANGDWMEIALAPDEG
jgi:hypothetical protein